MPPFWVQAASAVVVTALFILWVRGEWGGPWATVAFVDLASCIVPAAAAGACAIRARASQGELRTAWGFLAAGVFVWALGQAAWTYTELGTGEAPATPSLADAGYLGFIPLAAWGVIRFGRRAQGRTENLAALLDGAIVGASFIFIAFAFGLERTVLDSDQSQLAIIVNLLYPFGDAVILGVVVLRYSRAPPETRSPMALLAAGMAFLVVADLWFLVVDAQGAYATGGILDAFWLVGFLLIGLAALRRNGLTRAIDAPEQSRALAFVPLYPFFVATAVAVGAEIRAGYLSDTLFWTALTVILLVTARLMVMLFQNIRLARIASATLADLQEAQAMRSLLLNNVTHDLLSPMSPVRIQIKLLRDGIGGALSDRQAHSLDIVQRNVDQVARLAGDLKDLANMEAGRLAVLRAPCNLAELAHQTCATYQPEAATRGVALLCTAPTDVPVSADAGRIQQVLDNLMSNALKFTPRDGQVNLTVAVGRSGPEVAVADTGRGLEPDEAARLFKPFSQVHQPGEVKERGTGLGLFISRGIAEAHGGSLTVASQGRGKGATFTLRLPQRAAAQLVAADARSPD